MKTHEELKAELLEDPDVRREYEQLGPEFEFIGALIDARARAVGLRRLASQLLMVSTLVPMALANSAWETSKWARDWPSRPPLRGVSFSCPHRFSRDQ